VRAIEPRGHHGGDEELGSVGVFPSIGHGQNTRLCVLELKVLIWEEEVKFIAEQVEFSKVPTSEFLAIDGLATNTGAVGEITALKHKLRDHSVEGGTLVAKAVLASCELSKVFCGSRDDFVIKFENDSTSRAAIDSDVKLKGSRRKT
jgi:hypothetical protein